MLVFAVWVGFVWLIFMFLHLWFKTCMLPPYFRLCESLGLEIHLFRIQCRVTRFNRFMNRMGYICPSFTKSWFNIGVIATCLIYVPCVFFFLKTVIDVLRYLFHSEDYNSDILLVPVIPGINLPTSKLFSYCMVILICSVFHEFGHALAASREGISIEFCGFAMFFAFPYAFVNVRLDQFHNISKWQQMRIFCAGIWHNIVIALFACLTLSMFSVIMSPLYYTGSGVSVVKVHEHSGLNNLAGLAAGDHIYKIGACNVKDMSSWFQCIDESRTPIGLCIPNHLFKDFDSEVVANCSSSLDSLYFTQMKPTATYGVCLKVRTAILNFASCHRGGITCEDHSPCSYPILDKFLSFTSIARHGKPIVLYVGTVDEIKVDVAVSELLPRFDFAPSTYAQSFKEFFEYLLMFSCGLTCFNLVPAFSLDGEHIVQTLIHLYLINYLPRLEQRTYLFNWVRKVSFLLVSWWLCTVIIIKSKEYFI